jgi:hypothetical protein
MSDKYERKIAILGRILGSPGHWKYIPCLWMKVGIEGFESV